MKYIKIIQKVNMLNKRIFLVLFVFTAIEPLIAQNINLGSSIKGLTGLITNETRLRETDLGLWIENKIYEYEISSKIILLISNNYYPFGVLIRDDDPYFLIDIDGDSILDTQTKILYVPHWVVALNSNVKDNSTNIKNIFDINYRAFQNNESIRTSELIFSAAREIAQAGQNIIYLNRDILYIFYLYEHLYLLGEYQLCLKYLEYLDKAMISRFGGDTHVIILIYLVETLYKLGNYQKALETNNILLEWYPECIPGKVYQVLLESNQNRKNILRNELIKNYGEHWLVKEKLK
jgi:tetratricopeptide (TPR) repeat protein